MAGLMSGSGERGIFNRGGLAKQFPERRIKLKTNMAAISRMAISSAPSAPIPAPKFYYKANNFVIFEVVARAEDDENHCWKIRVAAILGTYQSSLAIFLSF